MSKKKEKKSPWHWSNILFYLLMGWMVLMIFNPELKGRTLQLIMKTGIYNPKVSKIDQKEAKVYENVGNVKIANENGDEVSLRDLRGKVIFINFWADWCPPCKAEMPSINDLYLTFENDPNVVFLMLDMENDPERSIKYVRDKAYDFPVAFPRSPLPEMMYKGTLPTTVVIDKKGAIVYHHEGINNFSSDKFKSFMKELSEG